MAAEGEQFAPSLYKNCKLSWDRNKLCHSKQTRVAEALWRAAEHRLRAVSIITGWAAKTETSDRFDIVYFFICHERFRPENPLSLWHCSVATNPVHDMTCSDLEAAEMSESHNYAQSKVVTFLIDLELCCLQTLKFHSVSSVLSTLYLHYIYIFIFTVLLPNCAIIITATALLHTGRSLKYWNQPLRS